MDLVLKEISDERLDELLKHYTFLYRDYRRDNSLWRCKPEHPRTRSLIWEPVKTEEVTTFEAVGTVKTRHEGFLFKPSFAEVMAYVPDVMTGMSNAFYIGSDAEMNAGDYWTVTTHFGRI